MKTKLTCFLDDEQATVGDGTSVYLSRYTLSLDENDCNAHEVKTFLEDKSWKCLLSAERGNEWTNQILIKLSSEFSKKQIYTRMNPCPSK